MFYSQPVPRIQGPRQPARPPFSHSFTLTRQIEQAAASIRRRWTERPSAGIILGTGMAHLAERVEADLTLDSGDVPHFPASTALGHRGLLICGWLAGRPVLVMDGRAHLYEGHSAAAITLPIRVMRALGAELLILSSAAGGMKAKHQTGDIVVIDDHVNLMWTSPLLGLADETLGPRFADTSRPYDPVLIDRAMAIARRENITAHRGVYVGMTGPNYETRAEYRFLRRIVGDVVGMSTVPEVIVAAQCGLRVLALSTVTNVARPDSPQRVDAVEVLHDAERAEPNVRKIVCGVLAEEAERP